MYKFHLSLLVALMCCAFSHQRAQRRERTGDPKVDIDLGALGQRGEHAMFTEVNSVKLLPQAVTNEFGGGIVDPGKAFQVTDVGSDKGPSRRLVVAGVAEEYCLVHYEQGGIVHLWMVALFKLSNGKAKRVWVSRVEPGRNLNLLELKAVVESGKLR